MAASVPLQAIATSLVQWLEDYVTWKMSPKPSYISRSDNAVYLVVSVGIGRALMLAWTGCQWLFMVKADQ